MMQYRVLAKAVVRAEADLASARVGVVEPGELLVIALHEGGRLQRREGGWVSEAAADGTPLAEFEGEMPAGQL